MAKQTGGNLLNSLLVPLGFIGVRKMLTKKMKKTKGKKNVSRTFKNVSRTFKKLKKNKKSKK